MSQEQELDKLDDFLAGPEWFRYREQCLDQLTAIYFELMTLSASRGDFLVEFARLQGYADCLYRQLRIFEMSVKKHDVEGVRRRDQELRQKLTDRFKSVIQSTVAGMKGA